MGAVAMLGRRVVTFYAVGLPLESKPVMHDPGCTACLNFAIEWWWLLLVKQPTERRKEAMKGRFGPRGWSGETGVVE